MNQPWVLIDSSYLAYRAMHVMGDLSYDDEPTQVIFGFLEQMRSICIDPKINSNRVALFFDSRQSYRRKAYSWYKEKRRQDRTPEEEQAISAMYAQVRVLKQEILPLIGVPCYRQVGLESDDLIAYAADHIGASNFGGRRGIIVSSDGDLFQCISQQVHWYDPTRRLYYDPTSFLSAKGVFPEMWADVKAVAGCPGDGVPGVEGVGIKTAVDYLCGNLPKTYKRRQAIDRAEGQAIIQRNNGLVKLPHAKTKPFNLQEPQYLMEEFCKVCERFGFASYLEGTRRDRWLHFFNMDKQLGTPRRRRKQSGKDKTQGLL